MEFITFFPSLFLVALFRRSKPRSPRKVSPVGEALHTIRAKQSTPTTTKSYPIEPRDNRFYFPWWCLIVAYVLSILIVLISIFFIIVRSAQLGDKTTRKWIGSVLASFCASVLLTQPMKVLSLAFLFWCLCRRKSRTEAFIENEDPIQDFTVSTEDARKFPVKIIKNLKRHFFCNFMVLCFFYF